MILTKIKLINFRNYDNCELTLHHKFNIIIGNNAQGKTNILEAIYVLALTKSYRTINEGNLINFEKQFFSVSGKIRSENEISKILDVFYDGNIKKLKINKKDIKKVSDYISSLNVILITPDDLELVKGSPIIRRNFLNIELSQISPNYLKIYNEFNKILKMRNEYLKLVNINGMADKRYLESITTKLIEKEAYIISERFRFINQINEQISGVFIETFGKHNIDVKYKTCVSSLLVEEIKNQLNQLYKKNQKKEIEVGMTLYGPHRDDMFFSIDGKDIKEYGSQGQQKSFIISLKLSEINIFEGYTKNKPLLLLDDIFSELDKVKRKKILKYIVNKGQIIITSNELNEIKSVDTDYKIFKIVNGKVTEKVIKNGTK